MRLFLGGRAGAGGGLHRPGHRQEERYARGGQEEDEEYSLLTSSSPNIYVSKYIYTLSQVKRFFASSYLTQCNLCNVLKTYKILNYFVYI